MTTEKLIVELDAKTGGLDAALKSSGAGLDELEDKVKKNDAATGKLTKSLMGMIGPYIGATAAVATLVAGMAKAIAANKEFSQSIANLSAITGATGRDLDNLTDSARDMGATTSFSATEAAEAMQLIASAKPDLLENAEALAAVTRETLTLAEASGVDLTNAAQVTAVALNQFGEESDQAARYVNVLAAGSKLGASEVAQTGEALKNAGVAASAAGISFEQTNAAVQTLAETGIYGAEAGTALRNIFTILDTQVDENLNPSVVGLSKSLENLADKNLSTAEMVKLFGRENVNTAMTIVNSRDSLDDLTEALTGTNIAAEQAAIRQDTLQGDINKMDSSTNSLAITVGDKLNPAMRTLVQLFTELVTEIDKGLQGPSLDEQMEVQVIAAASLTGHLEKVNAEIEKYNERIKRGDTGTYNSAIRERNDLLTKQAGLNERLAEAQRKQAEIAFAQGAHLGQSKIDLGDSGDDKPDEPEIDMLSDAEEKRLAKLKDSLLTEREMLDKKYSENLELTRNDAEARLGVEAKYQEDLKALRESAAKDSVDKEQEAIDAKASLIADSLAADEERALNKALSDAEIIEQSTLSEQEQALTLQAIWDNYYSELDTMRQGVFDAEAARKKEEIATEKRKQRESFAIANAGLAAAKAVNTAFLDDNKAIGAGIIVAETAVAVMRSLAELGPIAGPLAATAMIASGVAQLANLNSASRGGGSIGGNASGSVAPTVPTNNVTPSVDINQSDVSGSNQIIKIELSGGGDDITEAIMRNARVLQQDGIDI